MKPKDDLDELLDKWRLRLPLGVNPAAEQTAAEQLADDAFRDVDHLILELRRSRSAVTQWAERCEHEAKEGRARAKKALKAEKKARQAKGEKIADDVYFLPSDSVVVDIHPPSGPRSCSKVQGYWWSERRCDPCDCALPSLAGPGTGPELEIPMACGTRWHWVPAAGTFPWHEDTMEEAP